MPLPHIWAREPVGVPDFHLVRVRRAVADDQQLVEADAQVAVADGAGDIAEIGRQVCASVEEDEVVAGAVHLGEGKTHGRRELALGWGVSVLGGGFARVRVFSKKLLRRRGALSGRRNSMRGEGAATPFDRLRANGGWAGGIRN